MLAGFRQLLPSRIQQNQSNSDNIDPGQLTRNFHIDEFKCRDGSDVPKEYIENVRTLCENLQVIRETVDQPIRVISGYRTPDYNKKIKGAKKSQHMLAKAADIRIRGMSPRKVRAVIIGLIKKGQISSGGVGLYRTFVHYDIRGRNARWYGRGLKKK